MSIKIQLIYADNSFESIYKNQAKEGFKMSVNGILNRASEYVSLTEEAKNTKNAKDLDAAKKNQQTIVYEKSSSSDSKRDNTSKIYKKDTATINQLKADADRRNQQLRDIVEKMMAKQGQSFNDSTDIYKLLREGKVTVDSKTATQAKNDIGENGYWGIEQTSDRLVSFATALAGGNPEKADELMGAIQKGFEQATKKWGGQLPDICQQTINTTMKKMEDWKNSGNL